MPVFFSIMISNRTATPRERKFLCNLGCFFWNIMPKIDFVKTVFDLNGQLSNEDPTQDPRAYDTLHTKIKDIFSKT